MDKISKEYQEFLEAVLKREGLYERFCKFSERLRISPIKSLEKKYKEAIDFAHLNITPRGAFSFAFLASIIFSVLCLLTAFTFGVLSAAVVILVIVFDLFIFYYLYNYPFHLATSFRIKASSEMVLGIVYMTISMRISPNLENAVKFAASSLTGPLAIDLKKMLWEVYTRKYNTIEDALNDFIEKWRRENDEFVESIELIKTSLGEITKRRERMLDEAVSHILDGTKERMRHYAQDLRTPVTVLNAMGIMLPIIGLVFFPMVSIFLPEMVKPVFIAIGYNIILPITVYWMMRSFLEKRPYTFYQPDLSRHPQFVREKVISKTLLLSLFIPILPTAIGVYSIAMSAEPFSFQSLLYSLLILSGFIGGIVFFSIFSVWKKLKIREEIVKMEGEFAEALFQLGTILAKQIPIENALRETTPKIKNLKISKMFEIALHNMEGFGMTLEQAFFDKEYGAIKFYPSRTIEAIMRTIVETSRKGMTVVSKAMLSISTYLKDVHFVEEDLRAMLSEVTSTMNVQALLLAPLTSGIVVAMAAIMMQIMVYFKEMLEKINITLEGAGPLGAVGGGLFGSILNINQMMPVHTFQLIVGFYMVEVVGMLAIFLSIINNGEEDILKRFGLGKMLLYAAIIYVIVMISIYSVFSALMPVMWLT